MATGNIFEQKKFGGKKIYFAEKFFNLAKKVIRYCLGLGWKLPKFS
jgi:hypothetical protein